MGYVGVGHDEAIVAHLAATRGGAAVDGGKLSYTGAVAHTSVFSPTNLRSCGTPPIMPA